MIAQVVGLRELERDWSIDDLADANDALDAVEEQRAELDRLRAEEQEARRLPS